MQTEFGAGEVTTDVASAEPTLAEEDMNLAVSEPAGGWPPTYIGTNEGIDPVPAGRRAARRVRHRHRGHRLRHHPGGRTTPRSTRALRRIKVPGPNGGFIVAQGFTTAIELTPTVVYDAATDTFTNVETGVVYTDNGEGSFTNPDDPEDELLPGLAGERRLGQLHRDRHRPRRPSDPFFQVFVWTFVYAVLTRLPHLRGRALASRSRSTSRACAASGSTGRS